MTNPTKEREYPALPAPDTVSLAQSGRSVEYVDGYEAGFSSATDKFDTYADPLLHEIERLDRVAKLMQSMRDAEISEGFELRATIEHLTQSRATLEAQYNQLYELSGNQADTIERQREVMESLKELASQVSDHTTDSFRRGVIALSARAHAITALQAELEKKE